MRRQSTALVLAVAGLSLAAAAQASRQMELLGRGLVAVRRAAGEVYVGWRMLGTDPDEIAFNLYRTLDSGAAGSANDGCARQ